MKNYWIVFALTLLLSACGGGGGGGGAPASYTVGGTVSGLSGTVVLTNNGGDDLSLTANGAFIFATQVANGGAYNVQVKTQPAGQTCSAGNNTGTVPGANVTGVTVTCSTNTYSVGGAVSGLNGTVVLTNNGGDDLTLTADGAFTFATQVANGGSYNVQVKTQPAGQTCSAGNNTGTMAGAVSGVTVTCATNSYSVGGNVSGLNGTVVLTNNGGDDKTITADGNFTFTTQVAYGGAYNVQVKTNPAGQTCTPGSNTGTMAGAAVSDVTVTCSTDPTYAVRVTVTGLNGKLVLQNNGGDDKTITADGSYSLATTLANGARHAVTILSSPGVESCSVTGGTGTISGENATGITVNCYTHLFFAGTTDNTNLILYKSDGTTAGTVPLKSGFTNMSWGPESFVFLNGKVYFSAQNGVNDGLWESDGTEDGTKPLKVFSQYPHSFAVMNGKLYFAAHDGINGQELWESDGTEAGTKLVKDINSGTNGSNIWEIAVMNSKLYFSAEDLVNGRELWESDGTADGTKLVKDIYSGPAGSGPSNFAVLNGKLYFKAFLPANGDELWESDGTADGTKLVKDINAGTNSSAPYRLTVMNNKLYYSAQNGTDGYELWESDGTADGTKLVKDIYSGATGSWPGYLVALNGKLYFSANDGINGAELWESDGTEAGTKLVKNINSGANASNPYNLKAMNGKLYFTADDGVHGWELWESDGTAEGTKMIKDIWEGAGSGYWIT